LSKTEIKTTSGLSVSESIKTGDALSALFLFAQKEKRQTVSMVVKRIQFAFLFLFGKNSDKIFDVVFIQFDFSSNFNHPGYSGHYDFLSFMTASCAALIN
jgi:hypothetical protein